MRRMDLETYKTSNELSYDELARQIGVTQAKQARAYALGHQWPRSAQLQKILKACGGVTVEAMHDRRMRFLRTANERRVA